MADPKKAAGGRLFHVLHGESPFMYAVDMRNALHLHPGEWKDRPWTEEEIEAFKNPDRPKPKAEPEEGPEAGEGEDKPKRGRPRKPAAE